MKITTLLRTMLIVALVLASLSSVLQPFSSTTRASTATAEKPVMNDLTEATQTGNPASSENNWLYSFVSAGLQRLDKTLSSNAVTNLSSPAAKTTRRAAANNPLAAQDWFYAQRALPAKAIPPGALNKALNQRVGMPGSGGGKSRVSPTVTSWTAIGPAPTSVADPINIGPFGNVTGRVSALAYDNTGLILYAGSAEGGLWKSTNGGSNWTALLDAQPSLSVGAIALDPTNGQTIYVATGEANYYLDSYYSVGILKSTNGGQTWSSPLGQTTFGGDRTTKGHHIGKIVVDPKQSQNVLVAADNGLWLSQDGGTTWARKLGNGGTDTTSAITDLVVDGTSAGASTVYAAWGYYDGNSANGVYKSTDGGLNFTKLANAPGGADGSGLGRLALALAPSDHNRLYLLAANPVGGSLHGASLGVWSSSDAGASWQQKTAAYNGSGGTGPDLLGDDTGASPNTQRGIYSMVLAVDPASATTVYAGGINLFKSTDPDGGSNFSDITNVYITTSATPHPDQHALVFYGSATPSRAFYIGNDGGVYGSTDAGATWNNNNGNLAITQFYGGSTTQTFASTPNPVVWGGAQGNGTQKYTGTFTWSESLGGTGGFTANDPNNPNIAYGEQPYLSLYKTTDGGTNGSSSWNLVTNGINAGDRSLYVAPFVMDTTNPNRLLAGTNYVYETTDGAASWHGIGTQSLAADSTQTFGAVSALAIAPSLSSTVYAGTGDGKIWVSTNTGSGAGATWTDITAGTVGTTGRFVTSLAANPTNPQDVVVTFSGFTTDTASGTPGKHVYRSTNGGTSWLDITGNLPDSPVNSVLRNPTTANTLYIGTDTGFYYTNNAGDASPVWTNYQTGLPNVAIDQIFTDRTFTTFVAATHGRSMFILATSAVPTTNPVPTLTVAPGSLNFTATVGGANPPSQSVTLTATNGNINWTTTGQISYGTGATGWLSLVPSSGSLNSGTSTSITVTAATSSLAAGTYTATVTFQDTATASDKAVVNVTLVVSAAPVLTVAPTNLNFAATAGGANPASQVVTLTATNGNIGWTTLNNITYGSGATGWLGVTPTAGTLNNTSTPITLTASTGTLATGTYTATVTFQDTANSSDKAVVNVNFAITTACNPLVVSAATDNGSGTTCGTFSYAINQAKSSSVPVTISFATSVISVTGTLPTITSTNAVTITVEGGCSVAANGLGTPGVRLLAGSGAGANALTLGSKTVVDGLTITGFGGYAIDVLGSNNRISCNWLGTADGLSAAANGGGIQIGRVGGTSADSNFLGVAGSSSSGNLISGNTGTAIQVNNGGYNEAHFNWINYQKDGTTLLSNGGPAVNTEVGGQIIFSDDNIVGY